VLSLVCAVLFSQPLPSAQFSSDGTCLAVLKDHTMSVHSPLDGGVQTFRTVQEFQFSKNAVVFVQRGSIENELNEYDCKTSENKKLHSFSLPGKLHSVQKEFAVMSFGTDVRSLSKISRIGKPVQTFKHELKAPQVETVVFSKEGELLAAQGQTESTTTIWVRNKKQKWESIVSSRGVQRMSLVGISSSSNGIVLLTDLNGSQVRLTEKNMLTGSERTIASLPLDSVNEVLVNTQTKGLDAVRFASGAQDVSDDVRPEEVELLKSCVFLSRDPKDERWILANAKKQVVIWSRKEKTIQYVPDESAH
jgi:WD40 repeat protein